MKRGRQEDRLSALPDKALQLVLSHLPSDEAVRTSALSRRWRGVYAAVPVVDLTDPKKGTLDRWSGGKNRPVCFDQMVTGAILCKPPGTPIRTLRLDAMFPPQDLLDQWIVSAVYSGIEEIDVKLRYWHDPGRRLCPFGSSEKASADFEVHQRNRNIKTQPHFFGCSTLRRLRLTNWTLDLTQGVVVSSLETLYLARIMDPKGQLQLLLSSCPRLADLTLQELPSVTEISVKSAHLRRFTMICCHHASHVKLHSSRLKSLHYKGGIPLESLFDVANYKGIMALTIEICEDLSKRKSAEVAPVTGLISQCTELAHLHLSLRPSMAYHSSVFADAVRGLPLRQLGLKGCLREGHAVRSVAVLLRETKNLEVLSLLPLGRPKKKESWMSDGESDTETEDDGDDEVDRSSRVTNSLWQMYVRCLGHKLKRISIVNYKGLQLERILAHFLLDRGKTLEEFSVTSPVESSQRKDQMAWLLRSWRHNRHTRVTVH
ncbi:hypothetical protein CFC21_025764 [Triticum aestivum]|uniref:F-box domain-containing protein n=2 Tax=Triticum aestivum TaxID=4565 RepID=A0A9R1JC68_WHEAT|nr:hypothetical protein CFC21_025764 [Triticum aestivum]